MKNKKNAMSSLINESVVENALSIFRDNKAFITKRNGMDHYVGLYLKAESIGGFGGKSLESEDKGIIIQAMNAGDIAIYFPDFLINDEALVIIPTKKTLDVMEEYPLLENDAEYTVAIVHPNGAVENTDINIAFEDAKKVADDVIDIDTILFNQGADWVENEDAGVEPVVASDEYNDEYDIEYDNEYDDANENEEDDNNEVANENENSEETDFMPEDDTEYNEASYSDLDNRETILDDSGDEAEVANNGEIYYGEEAMNKVIESRFFQGDLDLRIPMERFSNYFDEELDYKPFMDNRPDGWLNEKLNEKSREANMAIKELHKNHMDRLRHEYRQLLIKFASEIRNAYDPKREDSNTGKILAEIKEQFEDQKSRIDEIVEKETTAIEKAWRDKLEAEGERASVRAKNLYIERNNPRHAEDIKSVRPRIEADIQRHYEGEKRSVYEKRKASAAADFEMAIVKVLDLLNDKYADFKNEEQKLYDQYKQEIQQFADDNRKHEIELNRVRSEELAQKTEADKVRSEYTEKLKAAGEDYKQKVISLKSDVERVKASYSNKFNKVKGAYESQLAKDYRELEKQEARIESLIDRIAKVDERKDMEYKARLAEANDQKMAWQAKCDDIIASYKRNNRVTIALILAAVIAALCVGLFAGTQMHNLYDNKSNAILDEFNERLDKTEAKYENINNKNINNKNINNNVKR